MVGVVKEALHGVDFMSGTNFIGKLYTPIH